MRPFQSSGLYPAYVPGLRRLPVRFTGFAEHTRAFLDDQFCAQHFQTPLLDHASAEAVHVAAGAVVTHGAPTWSGVAGNPANVVKRLPPSERSGLQTSPCFIPHATKK